MKKDDLQRLIQQTTDLIPLELPKVGIKVDYDLAYVKHNELAIHKLFSEEKIPSADAIFALGIFIGNTIIQNVPGAKWDEETIRLSDLNILIPIDNGSMMLKPIQRVMNFYTDRTNSIYNYIHSAVKMAKGNVPVAGGRIDQGNGYHMEAHVINGINPTKEELMNFNQKTGARMTKGKLNEYKRAMERAEV